MYLRFCLVPTLDSDDALVLGTSFVQPKLVRQVLEEFGIKVLFLLVYLPDFNPVEFMCTYVKCVLRKLKARTEEVLIDATVQALTA